MPVDHRASADQSPSDDAEPVVETMQRLMRGVEVGLQLQADEAEDYGEDA